MSCQPYYQLDYYFSPFHIQVIMGQIWLKWEYITSFNQKRKDTSRALSRLSVTSLYWRHSGDWRDTQLMAAGPVCRDVTLAAGVPFCQLIVVSHVSLILGRWVNSYFVNSLCLRHLSTTGLQIKMFCMMYGLYGTTT